MKSIIESRFCTGFWYRTEGPLLQRGFVFKAKRKHHLFPPPHPQPSFSRDFLCSLLAGASPLPLLSDRNSSSRPPLRALKMEKMKIALNFYKPPRPQRQDVFIHYSWALSFFFGSFPVQNFSEMPKITWKVWNPTDNKLNSWLVSF